MGLRNPNKQTNKQTNKLRKGKLKLVTINYHIQNSLHQLHIDPLVDPLPHMITLPHKCRESAYRNILRTTISTLWRMELLHLAPLHLPHNDCRKTSYIHIAHDDLHRRDLFKPSRYLRSHRDQIPLLRLRTQATSYIPSHLHLSNNHTYTPYDQRHCPSCVPIQIAGNEPHTLLHCPHSSHLSHPAILSLTRALRRFDLCSWSSHTPLQQTAVLLGSRPPKLLPKLTLPPLYALNSSTHFNPTFPSTYPQALPGPYRPSFPPLQPPL